jgi:dihydrofolate reductase
MIHLVVAMSQNRVIGRRNRLPWRIPEDLRHFRKLTMGKQVVMGRKTFESIGRPLDGRTNVIISRRVGYAVPHCIVATSLDAALCFQVSEDIFVIGGAEVYQQAIERADVLHITLVRRIVKGDAYFPKIDLKKWRLLERVEGNQDRSSQYKYSFLTYQKKT